jgi:hypothetical protein
MKEGATMAKAYIERENYCDSVCKCDKEYCDKTRCNIWRAPTADVAEVRHGEWIVEKDRDFPEFKLLDKVICSICRAEPYYDDVKGYILSIYCPNCGAKMVGKDDSK